MTLVIQILVLSFDIQITTSEKELNLRTLDNVTTILQKTSEFLDMEKEDMAPGDVEDLSE